MPARPRNRPPGGRERQRPEGGPGGPTARMPAHRLPPRPRREERGRDLPPSRSVTCTATNRGRRYRPSTHSRLDPRPEGTCPGRAPGRHVPGHGIQSIGLSGYARCHSLPDFWGNSGGFGYTGSCRIGRTCSGHAGIPVCGLSWGCLRLPLRPVLGCLSLKGGTG